MAKVKKDKEVEELEVKVDSKSILGGILDDTKGDHFNDTESKSVRISMGSLNLDSHVKIRSGQIIRFCGSGAELGKTSQAFVVADNYMKALPKSKTIYIKAEARLSPEIQERCGLKFVTKAAEWEYGTVFIWATNIFENIASGLETLIKEMHEAGEHLCFIFDSLDGAILKADSKKDLWGEDSVKVAGVPLLMKLLFRRIALPVAHYDVLGIITTQYSAAIKLDPYSKDVPRQVEGSGGSSIGHQSDYVFYFHPRYNGDQILEKPDEKPDVNKNKIIGVYATIEVRKSSSDVTGVKIKYPIAKGRVGSAIWAEKEIIDMLLSFSMVSRKGAWFTIEKSLLEEASKDSIEIKEQHQGINNLYAYIEVNKDVFNWLYKKIKSLID